MEKVLTKQLSPYLIYQKMASSYKLEFADLRKYPCDKKLLSADMRDEYIRHNAIPWKKSNNLLVIATCTISNDLQIWAENTYGKQHIFAITSLFDINYSVNKLFANENDADAREKLWHMQPEYSAKHILIKSHLYILISVLLAITIAAIKYPITALATAFIVTGLLYVTTMLFKTIVLIIGCHSAINAKKTCFITNTPDSHLPIYTILIPLYQEEKTLAKLFKAIESLDYPKTKLDVKLIVEIDDTLTINAIKKLKPSYIFEIITVPHSLPRTKPKACNYALRFARGKYITIYDAEDIPEATQLKKALYQFENCSQTLACVQARLNYFNREENLLTKMFAIEYSNLFDCILFGMQKINIPILLGGTSNHFRIQALRELYAWDPYNVTEDADIGLRIAQKKWHCRMIWSLTKEEAPISLYAWIKQRTRWIKGHMQTYIVHMRKPHLLYKKTGLIGFVGIQLFLGAPTIIFLISPLMWFVWALFMLGIIKIDTIVPAWFHTILEISIDAFFVGICLQILLAASAVIINKWKNMLFFSFIYPFYWILHSIASFRALWQLIMRPHYWEKTAHGVKDYKDCFL